MLVKRVFQRYSILEVIRMAAEWGIRRTTSRQRKLPDFLIIGGQRCGTTSLYNYLVQHPEIAPAFIKEPHYFDRSLHKGMNWYRAFFPLNSGIEVGKVRFTGEATPYYLFDPHVPQRARAVLPKAKLIILLRNPVDRAYSHYQFERQKGVEKLSFNQAIEREIENFAEEEQKVLNDENYHSDIYSRFSYLARGKYMVQIKRWREFYPEDQLLILQSEDLYHRTGAVLEDVFRFLGLSSFSIPDRKTYNSAKYEPMPGSVRVQLTEYFEPFNQQLFNYLGRVLNWTNAG